MSIHPIKPCTPSSSRCPSPYEAASNGELTSTTDHGETVTYVWESVHEMASYLAFLAVAQFDDVASKSPGG